MTEQEELEQQLNAKLDALITDKLDAALAPLVEKIAKLTPKEPEKTGDDAESNEKTDTDKAITLAADILRGNLKGVLKKEKLDAMTLDELQMATLLNAELNPRGIKNPVEQKNTKTDAQQGMWGSTVETMQ